MTIGQKQAGRRERLALSDPGLGKRAVMDQVSRRLLPQCANAQLQHLAVAHRSDVPGGRSWKPSALMAMKVLLPIRRCRTNDHRTRSLAACCLGKNTSANMQRALPPPMRSMVSMFTGNGVV